MDDRSASLVSGETGLASFVPIAWANRQPETADEVARAWLALHGLGTGRYLVSRRLVVAECYAWAWGGGLPTFSRHTLGRALAALLPAAGRETYLGNATLAALCPPRPRPPGRNSKSGRRKRDPAALAKALRLPRKSERRRPPEWEHGGGI